MKIRQALIAVVLILIPWALHAQERPAAEGMLIRSDQMHHEANGDLLVATGKVEMTWQDMTMTADRATYNRETKVLHASGNVYLLKGGDVMWGDQLVLDTETGRAEMENGRLFMTEGNFYADGKQIARKSEEDYAFRQGSLTTCDASIPSWKFGASQLDVTVEDYATGKNVIFYVKDIPVFYFPYIVLPVKKERQSGFLFPKFGNSTKKGVSLDIPFYWAISPSQEATIDLDLQTKRGVGTGLDYRYLRKRGSDGSIGGYAIYDNNEKKFRGQLLQFHREVLPDNLTLITSINLVTDQTFLADYAEKSGEYNRQYYDSRFVLTKFWNTWFASAQAIYTQDFYTASNTTTLQRLPELSAYQVREQVFNLPLYLDSNSVATNYFRQKGMQGQREMLTPALTFNQSLWHDRINTWLQGGAEVRFYQAHKTDPGVDANNIVAVPMFEAGASAPLVRIFEPNMDELKALRHELIPTLRYQYVAKVDQSKTPQFDQLDRRLTQNVLYLELESHLGAKLQKDDAKPTYRDISTVRLRQGYSFDGLRSSQTSTDYHKPLTAFTVETETHVHPNVTLLADAQYDHYLHKIATTSLGGRFDDQQGTSAVINYRWTSQQNDYLEGTVSSALLKPVYLGYTARYSFDRKDFLSTDYFIEYRHQCWSVFFSYTKKPNDWSWSINFNLAGLFSIGKGAPTAPTITR